jgi:hypothetical protein
VSALTPITKQHHFYSKVLAVASLPTDSEGIVECYMGLVLITQKFQLGGKHMQHHGIVGISSINCL